MKTYVLKFNEINKSMIMDVGGKGVNLGELTKINNINIPDGFCVTTKAYQKTIEGNIELEKLFSELSGLMPEDRGEISSVSKRIREIIENIKIDSDIENEILSELSDYDKKQSFAVRSSATAEDLPTASFAGQQDTYLNIKGNHEIIRYITKCWASLFTDRAVTYRIKNKFDHKKVLLSVVVQKMVMSEASGTMFTADPMTSDRKTLSIDAGFGLGEALVSGIVNPDIYKVKYGSIAEKNIGIKKIEIKPAAYGETEELNIDDKRKGMQVLSDSQILDLAGIGRNIEAYFNSPQDIEWCLYNDEFYIVQSRGITTLFPIPDCKGKETPRVYMSIGHTQMMTDIIRPLGMSFFEMISESTMDRIGGRIYADITHDLSSYAGKKRLVMATGKQDPLIQYALNNLIKDKDFMKSLPRGERNIKGGIFTFKSLLETFNVSRKNNPYIIENLLEGFEKEIKETDNLLTELSEAEALEFIQEDKEKLLSMAYNPTMLGAIIAGIMVSDTINKSVEKWIGEKNVVDILSKSVEHNVTTEMGLALCDLSDVARKYPDIINYISDSPGGDTLLEDIKGLHGGDEVVEAFKLFLDKYGMRCPGEIDITKDRWEEKPAKLVPLILNNINVLKSREQQEKFEAGKLTAKAKENEIIRHLESMPGGNKKAKKLKKNISILRNFIGCREYPKYYIVRRYKIYKRALKNIADTLAAKGIIKEAEDIYYMYFDELKEAVAANKFDYNVIEKRKNEYTHFEKLTPPRIITSDGYVPSMKMSSANIPEGSLSGIPVSSGIVEGRARVILSMNDAKVEDGDILVTQFTDPSWTPLFVTIRGLITEVGGFTTHGAVITREYGLPGVVGIENATKIIKDGQKIRLNGTEGYVEILE